MFPDMYVVITERDCEDPFSSHGAIIGECYTAKMRTREEAIERASRMGRYGRVWIGRVAYIEEVNLANEVSQ